jgi:hypothetical protein
VSTPAEMMDYVFKNEATITAVAGKRSWHSNRPKSPTYPNICYMEQGKPNRSRGMEEQAFTVNCRGQTAEKALALARVVENYFNGSSSTGMYGTVNGFDIGRSFVGSGAPLISEPQGSVYNVPVPVTIVYPSSTVS